MALREFFDDARNRLCFPQISLANFLSCDNRRSQLDRNNSVLPSTKVEAGHALHCVVFHIWICEYTHFLAQGGIKKYGFGAQYLLRTLIVFRKMVTVVFID